MITKYFMSDTITITDASIVDFYKKNPHLDIVTMNHILLDVLKRLSVDLTKTMQNTKMDQVMEMMRETQKYVGQKLQDTKKDYIEDVRSLLFKSTTDNLDKLNQTLDKNNEHLKERTTNLLKDLIPRENEGTQKQLEIMLREFYQNISLDTKRLVEANEKILTSSGKDEGSMKEFLVSVDGRFQQMLNAVQQPILSSVSSLDEKNREDWNKLRSEFENFKQSQEKISNETMDFLVRFKNASQQKGGMSENMLFHILQKVFPVDEIIDCRNIPETCDFRVNRLDTEAPTILFENKEYTRPVETREVKKFERDLQVQKKHGIFLSQGSGITFKPNFHIDIVHGLIHLYLCNVEYNPETIKTGVEIVDSLSKKLKIVEGQVENPDDLSFSQTEINRIVEEYQQFAKNKMAMYEIIKSSSKQLVEKLDEMNFPQLRASLASKGKEEPEENFKCPHCQKWSGKNKASLAGHIRRCSLAPKNQKESVKNIEEKLEVSVEIP